MLNLIAEQAAFLKTLHFILAFIWVLTTIWLGLSFVGNKRFQGNIQKTRLFLRKRVILPSMLGVFILGGLLFWLNPYLGHWIYLKFTLLFFYFGIYGFLVGQTRKAEKGAVLAQPRVFVIILVLSVVLPLLMAGLAFSKPF